MKIILIGDAKTGKTSYIQQLVYDKFREYYEPTYGCLIYVLDDNLEIWDFSGSHQKSILEKEYLKTDAIMFFHDVTQKETFTKVLEYFWKISKETGYNIPIAIIGNKIDLLDKKYEVVGPVSPKIKYFSISLKEKINWDIPLQWVRSQLNI